MAAAAAGPCAGAAAGPGRRHGRCGGGGIVPAGRPLDRGPPQRRWPAWNRREAMRRLVAVPAPLAASLCATSLCAARRCASPRRAAVEADCGGRGSSAELREGTRDKPERLTAGARARPCHRLHHTPTRPPAVRPSTPRMPTRGPPARASRRAPVSASPRAGSSWSSSSSSSSRLRCPQYDATASR